MRKPLLALGVCACTALFAGCEVDSWFDPSRTGYFENTPTSIPVLRKIDVIEMQAEPVATEVGPPKGEDLAYGNSEYQLGYGDILEIQINDLFQEGKAEAFRRSVDQSGHIMLPVLGQVEVAGLTQPQIVEELTSRLKTVLPNPEVDVSIAEARNYTFTVVGDVRNPGLYTLSRPDFDVVQAIALAGGADQATKRVRIVRIIQEEEAPPPDHTKGGAGHTTTPVKPVTSVEPVKQPETQQPETSIDDLINQLAPSPTPPSSSPSTPPSTPPTTPPTTPPASEPSAPPATPPTTTPPTTPPLEPPPPPATDPSKPTASLGAMRAASTVPIDIEQLAAPTTTDKPVVDTAKGVQTPPKRSSAVVEEQYIFDVQKQEWVLVPAAEAARIEQGKPLVEPNSPDGAVTGDAAARALVNPVMQPASYRLPSGQKTRVIEIEWKKLKEGDLKYAVIVRPDDKIYVEVEAGVVYIDGEIARPGVYSLPAIGDLTLSRLVSAAGGLGQIAIPQRVDLIRKIGTDREAAIRVNLAAIRNRAEPDIQLRADDHIIIGTNFWATPLAVIRNGFRMTYGFGFLLDRNFGNDVFGAPPTNIVGN